MKNASKEWPGSSLPRKISLRGCVVRDNSNSDPENGRFMIDYFGKGGLIVGRRSSALQVALRCISS